MIDSDETIKKEVLETRDELLAEFEMPTERDPEKDGGIKLPAQFIMSCIHANEKGDGTLYASVNRDRFAYDSHSREWYLFTGSYWTRDRADLHLQAVERVEDILISELHSIGERIDWAIKKKDSGLQQKFESDRDLIEKRIKRLRTDKGRTNCVKFARTYSATDSLVIDGEKFDQTPGLLGCPNGVIDLVTGHFRKGHPGDMITRYCPTEHIYPSLWEARADRWDNFLSEICDGNGEKVEFLYRVFGSALFGSPMENKLFLFWGPKGRNGKTTLINTLNYVLGPLSGSVQSEILLDQGRSRSSAAPSPDIIDLKGLRFAFASETDFGRKFSLARVKWLTGSDQLVGRSINGRILTRFKPSHSIFLSTNERPAVYADDDAFWDRVILILFELSFVDNPTHPWERKAIKGLENDLKREASGILAKLVLGCLSYQRNGLRVPDFFQKETQKYRQEEDLIGQFVRERCMEDPLAVTRSSELYESFTSWYEDLYGKKTIPSQKRFGNLMKKKFAPTKDGASYASYKGVSLR